MHKLVSPSPFLAQPEWLDSVLSNCYKRIPGLNWLALEPPSAPVGAPIVKSRAGAFLAARCRVRLPAYLSRVVSPKRSMVSKLSFQHYRVRSQEKLKKILPGRE